VTLPEPARKLEGVVDNGIFAEFLNERNINLINFCILHNIQIKTFIY